jgi:hypothetical protein
MTERYSGGNIATIEVWKWYKRTLEWNAQSGVPKGYWHYARFSNGVSIPKVARELFRSREDLYEHFEDPFIVEGDSFFSWLRNERPSMISTNLIGGFVAI